MCKYNNEMHLRLKTSFAKRTPCKGLAACRERSDSIWGVITPIPLLVITTITV